MHQHKHKLEVLFDAAFDLAPAEQARFLDRECAGNAELRRQVDELLHAAGRTTRSGLRRQLGMAQGTRKSRPVPHQARPPGDDDKTRPRWSDDNITVSVPARAGSDNDTIHSLPAWQEPATEVLEALESLEPIESDESLRTAHGSPPPLPRSADAAPDESVNALPTPGACIEQYEIIRELGRGGMGAVFLARDLKLGRRVAIKFLQSSVPALTERFLLEARATARCTHENIIVIHEVSELEGMPYMVLEYLKGKTLTHLMDDARLPPNRAVELIVPVVRALECAHKQGIVHRDLKPDNIFMTESGTIKVLDFGIAKVLSQTPEALLGNTHTLDNNTFIHAGELTQHGVAVGTLSYMAPEQWNAAVIDHRTDIWAIGIILFRMVTGSHPLAPLRGMQLRVTALLDQPMPSARDAGVSMPEELADVIDRCLRKRSEQRFASARQLLDALEPLLPGRYGRELEAGESPYTGLTPFQESDANRFFGRAREIARMVAHIHDTPLIGVIGPSGVGKSSFVRAGVIPALKSSGEAWEAIVVRPGRYPLAALANIVSPMLAEDSGASSLSERIAEHQGALTRLSTEPGYLGTVLRTRARKHNRKILLFVDQFEELYTLTPDARERMAFTACLAAMADDAVSPLRVMLSIRSDFLDRVSEDRYFLAELTRGLFFLAAPDRVGLRDAIIQPAEMLRHRFETAAMVEHMLDWLEATPGSLPLLQFTAARLWDMRDATRRMLTEQSYNAIGGISGALVSHADSVMSTLSRPDQDLVRGIFLRLVTPDRTRAIVSPTELRDVGDQPDEIDRLVNQLVDARLLVVHGDKAMGSTIELVHESLIHSWPTLARWLDESQEDAAYVEQIRVAAKQWDSNGRPSIFLWRGEAAYEARRWRRRYRGRLSQVQEEYLSAVIALAVRTARRKRAIIAGVIGFLSLLVAAAAVALVLIRNAEQLAQEQTVVALAAKVQAEEALEKQRREEQQRREAERQQREAERRADVADIKVAESEEELRIANQQLRGALDQARSALIEAEKAKSKAEKARSEAEKAKQETEKLLEKERKRSERLEKQAGTLGKELKK
jgi:eukaryotic-like serine/threonine-protein kinase